jgi:hypothetical protein
MAEGDISVLRIVGRFQSQNIVNTIHYFHDNQTTADSGILEVITGAWDDQIKGLWLARHSDAYTLIGLKAFRNSGGPKIPSFLLVGDPGGVTGTPILSFASRIVTFYTESFNHRRRGRIQLSGGEAAMFNEDDGAVDATEVGLMQTLGELIIDPLVQGGDTFNACLPAVDQLPLEIFTGALARSTPGVIRSRRVKRFFIG